MKVEEKILVSIFVVILSFLIITNLDTKLEDGRNSIVLDDLWKYSLNDSKKFIEKEYDDRNWKMDTLFHKNVIDEKDKEKINKVIWFRTKVIIPNEFMSNDIMLYISRMSNYHDVYFNGYLIGKTMSNPQKLFNDWNKKYGYFIPKDIIDYEKENTIAIRTYSTYEYGPLEPLKIEASTLVLKKIQIHNSNYMYLYIGSCMSLFAISVLFFFLYRKIKKEKRHLYFSLLCLITSIYQTSYFVGSSPFSYCVYEQITMSCMFLIPIFLLMFIMEVGGFQLLKWQKINIIIRIVVIIGSVFIFRDLVSYYIFRKYYFILFTVDFIVITIMVITNYIEKSTLVGKLAYWTIPLMLTWIHDLYFAILGKFPAIGFELSIYGIMWFLSSIALDLVKEHVDLYTKVSRDSLTGLYTQSFFKNELIDLINKKDNMKEPISLIMLDIDHFKKFNDTYGHLMGDRVLDTVASIIEDSVPKGSIVARYGGEEFGVILQGYDEQNSVQIAEQIRTNIEQYRFKDNERIIITISVGVTTLCPDKIVIHPESLIQEADDALYYSKNNGRNKVTHHKYIRYKTHP